MKMLHHKVNIVPVIAKADMLTKKEVARLKKRVSYYVFNNIHHKLSMPLLLIQFHIISFCKGDGGD